MLPEPGRYTARSTAQSVYENDNGVLVLAVNFQIDDRTSISGRFSLTRKDGSLNQRTIEDVQSAFGWDGVDPFWLVDNDLSGHDVEITVEAYTGNDGKEYVGVRYLDPPGGGGNRGGGIPESGDRRAILSKFGNQFRAMAGSRPRAPKPPQPATQTAPPPRAPNPVPPFPDSPNEAPEPTGSTPVRPATMAEAWDAFCRATEGRLQGEAVTRNWYECTREITGKQQAACSPEDWGRILAGIDEWVSANVIEL